mmetsp:Transcript_22372/g.37030  ORF Transcript_22372/g.37030 Transcript_22372/m.37030 type:complete len:122 (+) Transcript_22372:109-474(+)
MVRRGHATNAYGPNPDIGRKLPLTFIGNTASLHATIAFLKARLLHANRNNTVSGPAHALTMQAWLDSLDSWRTPTHEMQVNARPAEDIVPTRQQILDVCLLYKIDYLALQLPYPDVCRNKM